MTQPKLLITGARGFVGSQILKNLRGHFDIHAVSRNRYQSSVETWHDADLTNADTCNQLIRDIRPTYLVHSAWETNHGTFWEADSNAAWLEAGRTLFSAFQQYGGQRIVGCGTCAEYATSDKPLKETDDGKVPSSLYGQTKRELLLYSRQLSVSFAWARIFYPFGAHEDPARFVPSVCKSLLQAVPANCSSGQQVRNFMDVRDLGAAIAQLVSSHVEDAINLGQHEPVSLADVATMLGKIADRSELIRLGALPDRIGEPTVLIPDLSRQTNELKYQPTITLSDGLLEAYQWWKSQCV